MTNYPCSVFEKEVLETAKGIGCDHCKKWVHHKCNELSDFDFKYLQNNKDFWSILHKRNKPRKKSALSIYQNKPALQNLIVQLNDYSKKQNNENNLKFATL